MGGLHYGNVAELGISHLLWGRERIERPANAAVLRSHGEQPGQRLWRHALGRQHDASGAAWQRRPAGFG